MEFAQHLAAIRRQRGLTQAALAERVGVHLSQLQRYESGVNEPSVGVLRQLAVALSVTTDALVFGEDPRLPDDEALRLAFEATVHLDATERQTVRAVLEAFLARHDLRHGNEGPRARRTKGS